MITIDITGRFWFGIFLFFGVYPWYVGVLYLGNLVFRRRQRPNDRVKP